MIDYYITTDISDGKIYLKDINKLERADICAYLDNKKYLFSGFSALKYVNDTVDEVKIVMKYDDKYYSSKKISVLKKKKKEKDKINIAFLGGMVPEKGSEIAYEMVKCAPKEEFEWYSIGIVGDKKLNDLEQDNFHKTGEYQRNDLIDIIAACKIDIICILSIWPETFCYTLSEAIISNTPVLVTDIGAHGYRVKENGYGWYVDYNSDAQDIIDKIRVICENKDEYERVKAVAVNYKEKSVHEMCSDYIELYESLNTDGNLYKELNNRRFLAALTVDGDNVWNPEENYNSLVMKKNDIETGFNIANGKL